MNYKAVVWGDDREELIHELKELVKLLRQGKSVMAIREIHGFELSAPLEKLG